MTGLGSRALHVKERGTVAAGGGGGGEQEREESGCMGVLLPWHDERERNKEIKE